MKSMVFHHPAPQPEFLQRLQQALLRPLHLLVRRNDQDALRFGQLAWLGAAALPFYCVVGANWAPLPYDNLPLRLLGTLFCLAMVLACRLTSGQAKRACMFFGATFVLPFFFTFMFLMNHGAPASSQALLLSLVVLFSFEPLWALRVCACGTVLAGAAVLLSAGSRFLLDPVLLDQLPLFLLTIVLVASGNIGRRVLVRRKLVDVSQGVGSMSHELRTPLVSIDANVRGMQRLMARVSAAGVEDDGMCEALARVEADVIHMKQMIDMFALSSSALRSPRSAQAEISMGASVDSVIARYPFPSQAQRALVTVEMRADFVFSGQQELCVVVLLNLLRNALASVERAGKGRVRIVIDGRAARPRLLFIDTGCGIAASALPLIFDRFYSYPAGNGSGIGLSLCHQIMATWKARIRCVSRQHAYAIFVLDFPTTARAGQAAPGTSLNVGSQTQ